MHDWSLLKAFLCLLLTVGSVGAMVQWFCGKDERFCGKVKGFCGEDEGFLAKTKDFFFFFVFAKNPLSLPHCLPCILMREAPTLSMCRHINEGIPSTEHVQMLHWACADIKMRGNPVTDMTDNTEYTNWQCLHTWISRLWVQIPYRNF